MSSYTYRPDIDGLRSFAVLPVILFHLGYGAFSGGYVGVDVFFVISGFLITSHLKAELDENRLSIVDFYERRARRLLPALFAVLVVTLALGLVVLMPDELADLGLSTIATALFGSNILFWQQLSYFAPAIELKPLAHTWSLAVEEQYYLLFPLFLWAIHKWGRARYAWPVWIVAILSLAASFVGVAQGWTGTYYLLPTRAWELLAGSLLALGAFHLGALDRHRAAIGVVGLAGVVLPVFLLGPNSPFPGWNALWPVVGTALVLHAGSGGGTAGPVTRMLGWAPLVAIGKISYSLYLWHWPLVVLARYVRFGELTQWDRLGVLGATFLLSWASWAWVEQPFRDRRRIGRKAIFVASAAGILLFVAAGAALYLTKGLPARFGEAAQIARVIEQQRTADYDVACVGYENMKPWGGEHCHLTHGAGPAVLLWGDSHAHHYQRALRGRDGSTPLNIWIYGYTGCAPVIGPQAKAPKGCVESNARIMETARRVGAGTVVISAYWKSYKHIWGTGAGSLAGTVARLRAAGLHVRIVGDNPDFAFANPGFLAYRLRQRAEPDAPFAMPARNDPAINARLRAIAGERDFVDPMDLLCNGLRCLAYDKGQPMMVDNSHLSRHGAGVVLDALLPWLAEGTTPVR